MMTEVCSAVPSAEFLDAAQPQQQVGSQSPVRQQQGGVQYKIPPNIVGGDTVVGRGANLDNIFPTCQRQP